MNQLDQLIQSGVLGPFDGALVHLLSCKAHPDHAETIALTTALLSILNHQGHSFAAIDEWAGQPIPGEEDVALSALPEKDAWLELLESSGLVGDGTGDHSLVLDSAGNLRFARFHHAEQRIWNNIRTRLEAPVVETGIDKLKPLLDQLFGPPPPGSDINWHAVAAVSSLRHRFCVITGGPGTGKTHTVARVLALLLTHKPNLRIALAAPTGKAANRLTESIREQLDDLPVGEEIKEKLGAEAKTIHRLLGYLPVTDSFRFNKERKLDADVLVVDEASMVGLLLMDGLFEAMPSTGKIIILGDEYQLPSVEAGDLLADICREAEKDEAYGTGFVAACKRLTDQKLKGEKKVEPLRDSVIRLQFSWRFKDHPGIGEFTEAIRVSDVERAAEIMESDDYPDVTRQVFPEKVEDILKPVIQFLKGYFKSTTPEETLEKLNELRLLSATRVGKWGSIKLNDYIETWLRRTRMIGPGRHYQAQPVMVTANDYQTGLFNGDVGVCWLEEGQIKVCFPTLGGELRRVPLSKLPPHEPAWALTVHKSQGSEFERGLILLESVSLKEPRSIKLVYTAITRFKSSLSLFGGEF